MKKILLILTVVFLNNLSSAQDNKQLKSYSDKALSSITYAMHHPLHSWIGENKDVTAIIITDQSKNEISQVAVSVKISSFDSKNANRDSHAMEVTDALKYPNITFSSNSITQEENKIKVSGNITFHGVSRPISFEAEKSNFKNKTEIKGEFKVLMSEFNIEAPSLMGMATDDDIAIHFDIFF